MHPPVPDREAVTAEPRPPPEIERLPLYACTSVGVKVTVTFVAVVVLCDIEDGETE